MTATAAAALDDDQATTILTESMRMKAFEPDADGALPADAADRLVAAQDLVRQARLARAAGNRSELVTELLFIAGDTQPSAQSNEPQGDSMADLALDQVSDEQLVKYEAALKNYPPSDEVKENLDALRQEIERRGGVASPAEPAEETNGASDVSGAVNAVERAALSDSEAIAIRKALEDKLTYPMMRAHGIDPSEISSLSLETLQWLIDHPAGAEESAPAPAAEQPQPEEPDEVVQTTKIVTGETEEAPPAPKAEVPAAPDADAISPEREELEASVTGPMLKAFGRGRKDVPEIGINELRFMVEHPDGRVTKEQLQEAQDLDAEGSSAAPAVEEAAAPTIAEQMRSAKSESEETPEPELVAEAQPPADAAFGPESAKPPAPLPPAESGDDLAAKIIAREQFPIPEDIESPPRMPNDMSKVSQDELYGLHAQFHACESRANWIITTEEDKVGDLEKLLHGREVVVRNELPAKTEGRTKLTEAQREAMVAVDEEVRAHKATIHEAMKVVRKLRVLRDNYHRDVERCSRQMTRFGQEREGASRQR